jgi:hypothetical protein
MDSRGRDQDQIKAKRQGSVSSSSSSSGAGRASPPCANVSSPQVCACPLVLSAG